MKKVMKIEGMHCAHCKARVEAALNALPKVSARVSLDAAEAVITCPAETEDQALRDAVSAVGFTPGEIREKKLFSK